MKKTKKQEIDTVLLVQNEQLSKLAANTNAVSEAIDTAQNDTDKQTNILESIYTNLNLKTNDLYGHEQNHMKIDPLKSLILTKKEELEIENRTDEVVINEHFIKVDGNWDEYLEDAYAFFYKNNLHLQNRNLIDLLPATKRQELVKQINDDFTFKNANCDKYDYSLAVACGLIGGLLDILFVKAPGEGASTKFSDKMIDKAVMQFARFSGWNGTQEGKDPVRSAIGFLERNFRVNYDHRHGGDVDGLFRMSTKNHHIKSLAHSPDLVGLFFSILDQFTNAAHFASDGKIIRIRTENFELSGNTIVAKLFAGFANWLGHLFSDMAGSSSAMGRGSGIPLPFFSLLQFVNIGEFGQYRQNFATVAVQVFEKGYDLRHGIAMSIPVLITELFTRLCWSIKQKFYHKTWEQCIPSSNIPELSRMLLVAHGSLCIIDAGDAAARSGGQIIIFLMNSNIIAWVRFGMLSWRELKRLCCVGSINHDTVDEYLELEYQTILKHS